MNEMGDFRRSNYEPPKVSKAEGIKDLPRYLGEVLGGFFKHPSQKLRKEFYSLTARFSVLLRPSYVV